MNFWNSLDPDGRRIISLAALIPPPISLDFWATASHASPVRVLQLSEKMIALNIMGIYEPKGVGYYFFNSPQAVKDIVELSGTGQIREDARNLLPMFESEYPDGPKKRMALAYLYQTIKFDRPDLSVLIQAAEFCQTLNLRNDAAVYYQLVLDSVSLAMQTLAEKSAYIDATIGLCLTNGRMIPLQAQKEALGKALFFARETDDSERITRVLVLSGQVNKALGEYQQATGQFNEGWERARATGSEDLLRRVALATIDFLFWQGRLRQAIERYEEVLGNLETLPSDEPTLQACALLGYVYGKCGQTNRGIGLINAVMEKAGELDFDYLKIYSKVMTIVTLHDARRNQEAEPIIDELLAYPRDKLDHYLLWPVCAAKAYVHSYKGEYKEGFRMQELAYSHAKAYGHFHHRGPINFDYMDVLEDAGHVHPEMNYESEVNRVIRWPDIYMQGVGYYYRAKRTLKIRGQVEDAIRDLKKSIALLNESGAELDRSYSQLLLARLLIGKGDREKAAQLLNSAWHVLRYVNEKLFPEDLKHVVIRDGHDDFILNSLSGISNTIGTIRSRRELLNKIISLSMSLTGAERGAFLVPGLDGEIDLVASRNLDPDLVQTAAFDSTRAALGKVIETGKEIVFPSGSGHTPGPIAQGTSGWQIAYPLILQDKVLGCLYLERNLSGFAISDRILSMLKVISTQLAVALDNVRAYEEIAELKDQLEAETLFYRSEPSAMRQVRDIIGDSPGIKAVVSMICEVAPSDATVLIVGETGVGKELVAKAIHQLSNRSTGPFIPVSIASLSEGLISSELFGHEKGAFTNAIRARRGRFELANNGTLFLDEVNALSLDIQAKLLRVLEEKVFERVGGSTVIKPNFRLIAAANQPLGGLVKRKAFRSDLYYRLNVYPINVPPLRERKEDIPLLVANFVQAFNKKFNKRFEKIAKNTMRRLTAYHWPGNVRELKHTVERAVLSCKDKQLSFAGFNTSESRSAAESRFLPLKDMERQYIIKALASCGWKVSGPDGAAQLLGLKPQTLYSKINRMGIRKKVSMELPDGEKKEND